MIATVFNQYLRPVEVHAEQFGQWIVHPTLGKRNCWTVSDIESGRAMIGFSAQHVAINFARRLNDWFSVCGIAERMDRNALTEDDEHFIAEVIRMHSHPSFVKIPKHIIHNVDDDPSRGH